jgi:hypothetical protein
MEAPNSHQIATLLARYRELKTQIAALELALASIKAELDTALGAEDTWMIRGIGEVRRIPRSQTIGWNTQKLEIAIAALRLIGEDKTAEQLEEARQVRPKDGYLLVKLATLTPAAYA